MGRKFNKISKYSLILLSLFIFSWSFVFAQAPVLPTVQPPVAPGLTLQEIENILRRVGTFVIILGMIASVVFIIWGGISYMMSGGGEAGKAAKNKIYAGIVGSLVVIAVGVLLRTLANIVVRTFF